MPPELLRPLHETDGQEVDRRIIGDYLELLEMRRRILIIELRATEDILIRHNRLRSSSLPPTKNSRR